MHYRQNTILPCFILVCLCCAVSPADEMPANPPGDGEAGTDLLTRSSGSIEADNHLLEDLMACTQLPGNVSDSGHQRLEISQVADASLETCHRAIYAVMQILSSEQEVYRYPRRFDQTSMLFSSPAPIHSRHAELSPSKWAPAECLRPVETTATPNPTSQYVIEPRPFSVSKTSENGRRTTCENLLCRIKDLHEKCSPSDGKISVAMQTKCKMCHPRVNMDLVTAHCKARWRQEKKIFYAVCMSLIMATIASSLAIYMHKRRRMKQKSLCASNQSFDGPGPSISLDENIQRDQDKDFDHDRNILGEEDYWDGVDVPVRSSTAQQQWKQLGLFSRAGRKRIQDLFDLEAMKSRRDLAQRESQSFNKVPVMPWAPNATVRASRRPGISVQSSQRRPRANVLTSISTSKAAAAAAGGPSIEMHAQPKSDSIV